MKILVVEDDAKVGPFLVRVLTEEGYVVDACRDGEAAVGQAGSGIYDLLLLDWMLPGADGVTVCRTLRERGVTTPVLMLTARGEVAERVIGLEAGADDYLVKPFELDELLARVRALLRRANGHSRLVVGPIEIDRIARRVSVAGNRVELTTREYALLVYLAESAGDVVPRTTLLAEVWGTSFDPGSNLVEVQVSRLRDKLGEHAAIIDTVRGLGYRLRRDVT
jgi:two-component system OmpR family response regulator